MDRHHHRHLLDVVGGDQVCVYSNGTSHWRAFQNGGHTMRSNCLIFAVWRTIRKGGVLILQRSHAGPYLHAMWAEKLPSNLEVEHFSPVDKSGGLHLEPLFIGNVAYQVGRSHSTPPKERGLVSLVFLFFWMIQLLGWATLVALLLFPVYSYAGDSRVCEVRQARGFAAKAEFRKIHPCPATGLTSGACPGWQVDHVIPLASCGCDIVENLQWLKNEVKTCAGTLCKDRWERKINTCPVVRP